MLRFSDIIGQDSIKTHLTDAIKDNKISHAYIFAGEDGSGKMMLAERFAAALQCDGGPDRPCGCCINCMQSESRNHPDIIYVTHEKKNIAVDDIRNQLVNDVAIKPYSGQYKIYIVDEAEKMNEAAQNALLKTLEEPPEYAVILLLTTNAGAFLQTILSRCVTLELRPLSVSQVTEYLMNSRQLPDYVARLYASFSGGSIGKALRYASDEHFNDIREEILKLVLNVGSMHQDEIADIISSLGDKDRKNDYDDYFDLLSMWYRDVLMYKSTGKTGRLVFAQNTSSICEQAENKSYESLNNILQTIEKTKERLNFNVSFEAAMQLLVQAMKA